MTRTKEYDVDIKPIHIIKGQGICRLAAEEVHAQQEEELAGWEQEIEMYNIE